MRKVLEKLNELVSSGAVNPDNFYVITVNTKLQLQGKIRDSKEISKGFIDEGISFSFEPENGWARSEFGMDGVAIDITLTT